MKFHKATSDEELLDVYRLRYKVYCLERGYERMEDYPDGFETDEYDPYSVHFIAYVKSLFRGNSEIDSAELPWIAS